MMKFLLEGDPTNVLEVVKTAIASDLTPYLLGAAGAGIGIALVPWGGKLLWGIVKKFSK